MSGLNEERTIWIDWEYLGKNTVIEHNNRRYEVKIPRKIDKKVTLRLRRLGETRGNETGDLLLHIRLNKGDDVKTELWLSETAARTGASKILSFEGRKLQVAVPPASRHGLILRLKGLGRLPEFYTDAPLNPKRGNLLVKLNVYPDNVTPIYRPLENLTTDDMFMEGRVYRMKDEIIREMGETSFKVNPIKADTIANTFNQYGWEGIFEVLAKHLKLTHININVIISDTISIPGSCEGPTIEHKYNRDATKYLITINSQFLDNPFSVAAIMAHELCHIVYSEEIDRGQGIVLALTGNKKKSLENERMVDLLVFMFKIGEFQLRVSRDKRLTIGYFNQDVFERIQVIASKMKS